MSNHTKEELDEFVDEFIICEQTNFIDALIDDHVIHRCDIVTDCKVHWFVYYLIYKSIFLSHFNVQTLMLWFPKNNVVILLFDMI